MISAFGDEGKVWRHGKIRESSEKAQEKKINLPEFNPDEKTIAAINKISSFAKEDAIPVVVELSDYDPETILFDNGRPLKWKLVNERVTLSLRCIVDIKLNELKKYYI